MSGSTIVSGVRFVGDFDPMLSKHANRFIAACIEGRLVEAKRLLRESSELKVHYVALFHRSPAIVDNPDATVMLTAVKTGDLPLVRFMVEAGGEMVDIGHPTPLLGHAARAGQIEVMSYLLDQGMNIDSVDGGNGCTALMEALNVAQRDAASWLIGRGAACSDDVRSDESKAWKVKIMRALSASDVPQSDFERWSAADFAAANGCADEYIKLYEIGAITDPARPPLARALMLGQPNVVEACLAHPEISQPACSAVLDPDLIEACGRVGVRDLLLAWHTDRVIGAQVDAGAAVSVCDSPRGSAGMTL
jgi:hypothetical protein